jgi:hypothetical protein
LEQSKATVMFDSRGRFACAKIGSLVQGSTAALANGANRSGIFQEFPSAGSKSAFGNAIGTLESRAEIAMMIGTNPPENLHAFPGSSVRAKLFPVQQMSIGQLLVRSSGMAARRLPSGGACLLNRGTNEWTSTVGVLTRAEKRLVRSRRSIFVSTGRGESRE